jgi:hypothetical protein
MDLTEVEGEAASHHWAVAVAVSEDFLNRLAAEGVGEGIQAGAVRQSFALPLMGEVDLTIDMSIVEVRFGMHAHHNGRLHASITALGGIEIHGAMAMPMPGRARVRGEVLVDPVIEYRPDGTVVAQLDVPGSELVGVAFLGIEGIDTDMTAQEQMGQMLFAAVGGELFSGLANSLGPVGLELGPDVGAVFAELGVAEGAADVSVADGAMIVGLEARPEVHGNATVGHLEGSKLGVGVAAGALSALVNRLAADSLGTALPFELEVLSGDNRVGARVRNSRLVSSDLLPDLRPGLRTTFRPRLVDEDVVVSLREAWLELPLVPSALNRVSRWFGGVASRAPLSVSIPRSVSLPVSPTSAESLLVRVADIEIAPEGVHLVVEAHL